MVHNNTHNYTNNNIHNDTQTGTHAQSIFILFKFYFYYKLNIWFFRIRSLFNIAVFFKLLWHWQIHFLFYNANVKGNKNLYRLYHTFINDKYRIVIYMSKKRLSLLWNINSKAKFILFLIIYKVFILIYLIWVLFHEKTSTY